MYASRDCRHVGEIGRAQAALKHNSLVATPRTRGNPDVGLPRMRGGLPSTGRSGPDFASADRRDTHRFCSASTTRGLWRSLVSALDWGSRGPGFKSRQPDWKTAGQRRFFSACRRRRPAIPAKSPATSSPNAGRWGAAAFAPVGVDHGCAGSVHGVGDRTEVAGVEMGVRPQEDDGVVAPSDAAIAATGTPLWARRLAAVCRSTYGVAQIGSR